MDTVTELAAGMQQLLGETADRLGKETKFVKRERELTGSRFAQTLVFGFMDNASSSLSELAGVAGAVGAQVTAQGVDRRFTPEAATFLHSLLCEAATLVFESDPVALPLLARFTGVYVQDGSVLALSEELARVWSGCGGSNGPSAALKLGVRLELLCGGVAMCLIPGRAHDRSAPVAQMAVPRGAIRLTDLGYFGLEEFKRAHELGAYYLSRPKAGTVIYDRAGRRRSIPELLGGVREGEVADIPILLGARHKLPARLIAQQAPEDVALERESRLWEDAKRRGQQVSATRLGWSEWTLYLTNAPGELLSAGEALVLARARWQIELLFRLWKSEVGIDESVSSKPYRQLCEVYAKLIAALVQHWLMLTGCWHYPDRSLVKAARTVRKHALHLASSLCDGTARLAGAIKKVQQALRGGACKMSKRKKQPNTYQLLQDPLLAATLS